MEEIVVGITEGSAVQMNEGTAVGLTEGTAVREVVVLGQDVNAVEGVSKTKYTFQI